MKKLTSTIYIILLITLILFGNALWYFYSQGYIFRSQQSYRMREFLSSISKIIIYLLPALILFRTCRKQSRKIDRHPIWGPFTIIFTIVLILVKTQFAQFISHDPTITLLTYGYVLIANSMIEEYVFRGILFSKFLKSYSFGTTNILQACCFALVHIPFYIRMGRTEWSLLFALGGVTLLGLRRGYVKKQTNGLFYPALLHSVRNGILIFL